MGKLVKVLLTLSLGLLLATSAFAKDSYETGNWFLSGSSNLNFAFGSDTYKADVSGAKESSTDHTVFGLGTRVGYFVVNGFEVGLGFLYDYDQASYDKYGAVPEGETTMSSYLVGVQGAYFYDLGGMDPFFAALIGFHGTSTETAPKSGSSTTTDSSGLAADVDLGVNFLLTGSVGLAPSLYSPCATRPGRPKAPAPPAAISASTRRAIVSASASPSTASSKPKNGKREKSAPFGVRSFFWR
ncbi:MAG: hypothetical protein M5R36_16695 [Deltaproteobacteria bacterium]|nr:hypothetical protein [Deltaproteobacteria bacterium]